MTALTSMLVRDLMTPRVHTARAADSLSHLRDLMYEHNIRHVPVVDDDGELVGLVSQRDLLRNSLVEQVDVPDFVEQAVLDRITVEELMTTGVASVDPDTDIREAAQLMWESKFGCLPVVEGQRLVGILTESDFVRLMAEGN